MSVHKIAPPKVRRVSLRALVRLLALLLVPVVIVTWPGSAQAVDFGPSASATLVIDRTGPGAYTFKTNARYAVDGNAQGVEMYGGICQGPMGGECNQGETYQTSFRGQDSDGNPCTVGGAGTFGNHPDDTWHSELVTLQRQTFMPLLGASCTFTQWCVDLGNGTDDQACVSITIPPYEPPSEGCPFGHPTKVSWTPNILKVTWDTSMSPSDPQQWIFSVRQSSNGGASWYWVTFSGQVGVLTSVVKGNSVTNSFGLAGYPVQGVQVSVAGSHQAGTLPSSMPLTFNDRTRNGTTATQYSVDPGLSYYGGITDPGRCRFWTGPKLVTLGDTTADEVWLPLETDYVPPTGGGEELPDASADPVDDEGATCDFSWTDPTTWASGGICALVAAVRELISVVSGIVSAVIDGIAGLFMPSDGYLNARVATTRDKLNDTTPGKWLGAFTGLSPGSGASGCGGIQVAPPNPGGTGVMFDVQLGAACSGNMASIASLVRLAISAAVVVGGGLACIRALGSGLGWNPGVGRGESV